MRIVSLVPAATDWIVASGADDLLVGITDRCAPVAGVQRVATAGTDSETTLLHDEIARLAPDLLIVPERPAGASGAPGLTPAGAAYRHFVFASETLKQVLDSVLELGALIGRMAETMDLLADGERRVATLRTRIGASRDGRLRGQPAPPAAIIIGGDPWLVGGRWWPDVIEKAGGSPAAATSGTPDCLVDPADISLDVTVFAMVPGRSAADVAKGDLPLAGRRTWGINGRSFGRPGPSLYRLIEVVAHALHGAHSGVLTSRDELAAAATEALA